jgi:hypothetical protein
MARSAKDLGETQGAVAALRRLTAVSRSGEGVFSLLVSSLDLFSSITRSPIDAQAPAAVVLVGLVARHNVVHRALPATVALASRSGDSVACALRWSHTLLSVARNKRYELVLGATTSFARL